MKTLLFFPLGQRSCILIIVNALLAISLTVLSFRYIQPKDCYRLCGATEGTPCPSGSCRFGEQKAGWPLPVFIDAPGGGSPTGGWGMLGPEDLPLPVPLILDVLFYSILLWLALYIVQFIRRQTLNLKLIAVILPLNIFLAIFLWVFYMFFGYYVPIGRGHDIQVYVDTPTSTTAVLAFSPIVLIPLQELIENFGEPDYVWFISNNTAEAPGMGMALDWDAAGIFVELPAIADKTYVVQKTTPVEMIIFFNERQRVLRIDGKPLVGEKDSWVGYGIYYP